MARHTPKAPPRLCSKCNALMTSAGRRSQSGRYYCSKDACQAEKLKANYDDRTARSQRLDAPTICHGCKDPLKPRKIRSGDSPTGLRWCNKPTCRGDRVRVERDQATGTAEVNITVESYEARIRFLHLALSAAIKCPACGQDRAVPMYLHPKPKVKDKPMEVCTVLGMLKSGDDARAAWPEWGPPPAKLELAGVSED